MELPTSAGSSAPQGGAEAEVGKTHGGTRAKEHVARVSEQG